MSVALEAPGSMHITTGYCGARKCPLLRPFGIAQHGRAIAGVSALRRLQNEPAHGYSTGYFGMSAGASRLRARVWAWAPCTPGGRMRHDKDA